MPNYNLAFLGFGNVGQALARLLLKKRTELERAYDLTFRVTGLATGRHGSAIDLNGLDLEKALAVMSGGGSLTSLSRTDLPLDSIDFIRRCGAQVLFENTPVDYHAGQPAISHLRLALQSGMHAITANKGPVVHAYRELSELADRMGVKFYFESTVMDGAPIFSLFRETLPAARIRSLRGVLNSTTNLILSRMEAGEGFDEAVAYAQKIGIAETDPSGDIDGWDAAVKVAALTTVILGVPMKPDQVNRRGIREITQAEIQRARREGGRWKLVCSAVLEGDEVRAQVSPEIVPHDLPMYGVEGTTSIVQFESDVLGLLSIIESDPGPHTTAYGLFADFLNAVRSSS